MDLQVSTLRVLMFPWLGYGHISTYLNIAKKLANRGLCIYFCSTPINLNFIKEKIPQKYSLSIHLIELHLPILPNLPPSHHTCNGLPPHLHSTLKKALNMSKPNFAKIVESLKPDLLMYDLYQPWAQEVAYSRNIPAVKLLTSTAAFLSYFFHSYINPDAEAPPFPPIYSKEIEERILNQLIQSANAMKKKNPGEGDFFNESSKQIALVTTSRAIEDKYIEYLENVRCYAKVIPLGSLIHEQANPNDYEYMEIIDWLGSKDENSTIFVSFGSEHFLNKEDLEEIAFGLEQSDVNFIWVVKFQKTKHSDVKLEEVLPEGFIERIGDRGRVVDGWAPQQRILSHQSIGGFVSHCGFNSVMESVDFGVPIIAMPVHLDQPINARLMVEIGVALEVVRDNEGKVHREEIIKVIKSVINDEIGDVLRMKVKEISQNSKFISEKEMDAAVQELIHLCKKDSTEN